MLEIEKSQQNAIRIAFAAGIVILIIKFAAYLITGSTALLSDALESIINVIASAFAMWSIHMAKAPPDSNHPYGHGKIEYFSALFEGVLIIFAAACIIYAALPKVFAPENLSRLDYGLLVSVLASIMNLVLGLFLVRRGKKTKSLTLVADGKHVLTDVYTTAGVLIGLSVVWITNWLWMDGVIACVVALNIIWTGYGLVRQAVKGLMNETDHSLTHDISTLLNDKRQPGWVSVKKLRAWSAGRFIHIDFCLVLPRQISLEKSMSIIHSIEDIFRERFDGVADVIIKTDICSENLCKQCLYTECSMSKAEGVTSLWDEATLCSKA